MRFQNKVALITGGAQGMGEAIARGMVKEGARVALFDINEVKLNKFADELKSKGFDAAAWKVDITKKAEVDAAVKAAEQKFGKIDILVNVAGGDEVAPFIKTKEEMWEFLIALNYKSVLYTCKAVLDGMIARNYGRIVNIASDAGRVGSKGEAVYSGAKAGVIAFSKTLAREVAANTITVNSVSPGPTLTTGMQERSAGYEKLIDAMKKNIPLGRLGSSEDIAGAVLYFASDDAAFVTGQCLSVSGGLNMV